MVISTALFDKPPFKNLVVNGTVCCLLSAVLYMLSAVCCLLSDPSHALLLGLVLAGDGKKMSKRLQNYPDPSLVWPFYNTS
jgi:isoleucyl-tRNA synthetase